MITKSIVNAIEITLLTLSTRWIQKTSSIFNALTLPIALKLITLWITLFLASCAISFILTIYLR